MQCTEGIIMYFKTTGFHVSMKMKKAAVALCANNAEIGRGRKNINRKHG